MAAVVKMITDDPWASLALTGNEVRSALAGCPRMPGRLLDRVPLGRSYPPRIYTHPFPSTLDNFRCNDPSYRVILRLGRIWNGFENLLDSFFLESCPIFWNFFQLGIRCLRNLQVLPDFACFKQNKIKIKIVSRNFVRIRLNERIEFLISSWEFLRSFEKEKEFFFFVFW